MLVTVGVNIRKSTCVTNNINELAFHNNLVACELDSLCCFLCFQPTARKLSISHFPQGFWHLYKGMRNTKDCCKQIPIDETDVSKTMSVSSWILQLKKTTSYFTIWAPYWINKNETKWTIPEKFWKLHHSWIWDRGWLCCLSPESQKFPLSTWWYPGPCW